MQCPVVKTRAVHCHCDVRSAPCGYFSGCRTSQVCQQHHATVVTSHGVTICGSKFPPTVSKHCQRQHSAIHKTIQQCETPTIPAVVISKVLLPQSNIMTAFVYSHRCLFRSASIQKPMSHILQFYSVRSLAADPLRTPAQNVQLPTWSSQFLS